MIKHITTLRGVVISTNALGHFDPRSKRVLETGPARRTNREEHERRAKMIKHITTLRGTILSD